jgi:hypothetical protein
MPASASAKCGDMKHYFCVPIVFQSADPGIKKSGAFPKYCSGLARIKDETVGVVFQDEGACPQNGTALVAHVTSICQDTGAWTKALYWVAPRPAFCLMSHDQRRIQAKELAGKIHPGMTRSAVRTLLKDYEYIGAGFSSEFSEQFYGHPNVVIEVPFNEPDGNYSGENKVNGRASIADIDMPQP